MPRLRQTLRALMRERSYSSAVLLSLALGMAGPTVLFSVATTEALRPLWRPGADAWVEVVRKLEGLEVETSIPSPVARSWLEGAGSFEALGVLSFGEATLRGAAGAELIDVVDAGPGLLALTGVRPRHGRLLGAADRGMPVALISARFWRRHLAADPGAVGATIHADGQPLTVVGVLPEGFGLPMHPGRSFDLVRPLDWAAHVRVQVVGRLAKGWGGEAAVEELTRHAAAIEPGGAWAVRTAADRVEPAILGMLRAAALGGLLIILVTASNLAHVVASRTLGERQEEAVRHALGAGRFETARRRATEAAILGLGAAALATLLAWGGLGALTRALPEQARFLGAARVDEATFGFAALVAAGLLIAVTVLPSLRPPRAGLALDLRAGGRQVARSRAAKALGRLYMITVVAASFLLSVLAFLVVATVLTLGRTDVGLRTEGLVRAKITLPAWKYGEKEARAQMHRRLLERFEAMGGVEAVSIANRIPPETGFLFADLHADGRAAGEAPTTFGYVQAGQGYFEVMGQALLAGRPFEARDLDPRQPARTIIVSESVARLYWGGATSAVGRRLGIGTPDSTSEVVGVVADVEARGLLDSLEGLTLYVPYRHPGLTATLVVRSSRPVTPELRALATGLEPDLLVEVDGVARLFLASITQQRFLMMLLSLLAILAVLMAAVGVYGVLEGVAARQRGAMAVRMALGADATQVRRWLVGRGLLACGVGLGLGYMLSFPLAGLVASQLHGFEADHQGVRLAAAALVLAVATAANAVPAWRAGRVEPSRALREI